MSEHTKGPWIVIETRHPYKDGSKAHIERRIYTQRIDPQLKDHYPVVCMSIGIGMEGEKAVQFVHIEEDDARLIAAAPELLGALELIVTWNRDHALHQYGDPNKAESWACVRAARAAIAKAIGESK